MSRQADARVAAPFERRAACSSSGVGTECFGNAWGRFLTRAGGVAAGAASEGEDSELILEGQALGGLRKDDLLFSDTWGSIFLFGIRFSHGVCLSGNRMSCFHVIVLSLQVAFRGF